MSNRLTDKYTWEELVIKVCNNVESTLIKAGYKKQEFIEWLSTKESLGYVFDYNLWLKAFLISKDLNNDVDYFTVCSGKEGTGKSTLLAWFCSAVSPTFSLKNICFEMLDLGKLLKTVKPRDSIILDEGLMFMFSREAMTGSNKMITKLFSIMRQKNIHIAIAVPNFFNLDTYVREHRVNTLLHISTVGKYMGLNKRGILYCNDQAKRLKNPSAIRYKEGMSWRGYWNKENKQGDKFPVINDLNHVVYKDLKAKHMDGFLEEFISFAEKSNTPKNKLFVSTKEFSQITGANQDNIGKLLLEGKLKGKKIGSKWFVDRIELESGRNRVKG